MKLWHIEQEGRKASLRMLSNLIKKNSVGIQIMVNLAVLGIAMIKHLGNVISNSDTHFPWQRLFFPCHKQSNLIIEIIFQKWKKNKKMILKMLKKRKEEKEKETQNALKKE